MRDIDYVKERFKNLPGNHPVVLVVNGIEYPLQEIHFHQECVLLISQTISQIPFDDVDNRIKIVALGEGPHQGKIAAIKMYRQIYGGGLKTAKEAVEKLMG